MSTTKRNVRTQKAVLAALVAGSILSAWLPGASAIGPHKAFAETTTTNAGALGVGERTIAPLTEPVTTVEKVPVSEPASSTAATATAAATATVSVGTVKKVAPKGPARTIKKSAAKPKPVAKKRGKPWKRAKVSWYGPGFYGRTMAGGGRLGRNAKIVAHKKLPFGTKIQFSLKGRTVTAIVKDRGPYIHGRVFDLGPGTAKALHFNGVGVVKYRIITMGKAKRRR